MDPAPSLRIKIGTQFLSQDVAARLSQQRATGARVELGMAGDGEDLPFPRGQGSREFHMATALRNDHEPEPAQNSNDILIRSAA